MPSTIKQAVELICEEAARKYAPRIWLDVPFTTTKKTDNEMFTHVEIMIGNYNQKVIWDPKAPSPLSTSTCILVSDGFGNFVATTFDTNQRKQSKKYAESDEKQDLIRMTEML